MEEEGKGDVAVVDEVLGVGGGGWWRGGGPFMKVISVSRQVSRRSYCVATPTLVSLPRPISCHPENRKKN